MVFSVGSISHLTSALTWVFRAFLRLGLCALFRLWLSPDSVSPQVTHVVFSSFQHLKDLIYSKLKRILLKRAIFKCVTRVCSPESVCRVCLKWSETLPFCVFLGSFAWTSCYFMVARTRAALSVYRSVPRGGAHTRPQLWQHDWSVFPVFSRLTSSGTLTHRPLNIVMWV